MIKKLFFNILLLVFFVNIGLQAQQTEDDFPVLKQINPLNIKGHMTFLSEDDLMGRRPGSEGFQIASNYVKSQFIALGLKPANEGSYYQKVPLVHGTVKEEESSASIIIDGKTTTIKLSEDIILSPYYDKAVSEVTAPLVFVGYGITAPEFDYDDYSGVDVKGKIVVYINSAPSTFPTSERAFYSGSSPKYDAAIKNGAIGVISFMHPSNTRRTWASSVSRSNNGGFKWKSPNGIIANSYPDLKVTAFFNNSELDKIFGKTKNKLEEALRLFDEGKSISFPMNVSANIKVATKTEVVQSHNLLGEITGTDPVLKDEYMVYAAHVDHLGIGRAIKGDSIYNGAHDNASGVAILLEIAKTFQALEEKPKRSILFAIVTGEESGLLGSDYLANNRPKGKEKMVANIAMDMPFFFHPILDIVPYGAVHSSLGNQTKQVADILGLKISPDPFPEQVIFIRSDHYSFIKQGIPALFIKSGFMTVPSDTVDRSITDVMWRRTHYHTPQDDMNQPFDFNAAATHVKVDFLIGYLVANEISLPKWNVGDFFGNKLGKKN
ncbi:peptidase M28 [Arcticibacterium luteifluviistationis]|uniref:Peptidase M28 n=2 Tax=Arcticibacterium luteifluviistationis TaxID=1784714 RepID=A0A2Z4GHN8_9BACT|nr:peptidase M28 [Arcticibacterium luteifluviistationis]